MVKKSADTRESSLYDVARAQLLCSLNLNDRGNLDLLDRFDRYGADLIDGLAEVYDLEETLPKLVKVIIERFGDRDEALRQRDRERILSPDWFQSESTIGYVAYTDLFAGDLKGLASRIDYLRELKVSYLHLMPILEPRPGANDGGYAVMNYRALRRDLGTMQELRDTAQKLHEAGISLTLDLVLNHVALEHEWAEKARNGEAKYRDYFYVYPDRKIPDQFEQTLPEVFPDFAPGNFTYSEDLKGWVWTTFNDYQWDVNWSNPDVFCEFADIIGNLANHGVDCLRLDAIAFIFKRMGTTCQSEPEVHAITQALRAFSRILAPSLIFKAEAIVGPNQVGAYLGEGKHAGKVSDLAYHNSLMVQIWAALASKDTSFMSYTMNLFKAIPTNTAWGAYLRCHDDIGWAIDDGDAARNGFNGHDHRMFLADYYTGKFPTSNARGVDFQTDPQSGERRTSGSAAALAGIQAAFENKNQALLDEAINRYICAYAMIFGFGGIPLLYMGDEIAMFNDEGYLKDPTKAEDNRWINRPAMDWSTALSAATGNNPDSVATRIRRRIDRLIEARTTLPSLHAAVATKTRAGNSNGVIIFERQHPAGNVTQVYNLTDNTKWVSRGELSAIGDRAYDHITGNSFNLGEGLELHPYQALWLS
ncbi:MAG: Amylosucrase [Actinomycetota bacterium]|jgi:amylosucrase